jgi:hypothetical protein
MSTLVLVMAAGMVLGDGPQRVSGEVEQGLDLRGEWEGTWYWPCGLNDPMQLSRGTMTLASGGRGSTSVIADEGGGRCRFSIIHRLMLGIYEQDPDRVIICFREGGEERPVSFERTAEQHLLILHRVKPGK